MTYLVIIKTREFNEHVHEYYSRLGALLGYRDALKRCIEKPGMYRGVDLHEVKTVSTFMNQVDLDILDMIPKPEDENDLQEPADN